MKLGEIAKRLNATLVGGSADIEIAGIAGIEEAGPRDLTFVSNPRYAAAAKATRAAAVIVAEDFPGLAVPTLRVKDPYLSFARALDFFYQPPPYPAGVHPTSVIHPTAKIGRNAHIAACVVIGEDVVIGDDCVLLPHVVIYRGAKIGHHFTAHAHAVVREYCEIGNRVTLQNGVIIGGDGFGFAKDEAAPGRWRKIAQSGPAVIEDDVEIQSNACVDRASIGETRIERGAKLDNLVQVGHGSRVGASSLLCAQVGLAGSTKVGRNAVLAGQVGVAGHCRIGEGAVITAQSGVPGDVPDGAIYSGYPAMENKQWLRASAIFRRLPQLLRQLRGPKPGGGRRSS